MKAAQQKPFSSILHARSPHQAIPEKVPVNFSDEHIALFTPPGTAR
jgi:hypothetical protein